MRSPIFYDSNDTYYYVDPNSTSRLVSTRILGEIRFQNGSYYNNLEYWGARMYSQDDGNGVPLYVQVQWVDGWRTALKIASGNDNNNPSLRTYGITQLATDGGFVGVATTSPVAELDVNGRIVVRNSNRLYWGVSSTLGSWTTAQYASGSTHRFNAQRFDFTDEGYGSTTFAIINSEGLYTNNSIVFPQTQFNPSAGSRTSTPPMSIRMFDNYFSGIGLGSDYGTILEYYSRIGHVNTQVYFDAAGGSWYRTAAYAAGYGAWNKYITSGDIGSQSVSYASSAGSSNTASYLPTLYAGGVQANPQTYFSNTTGLRVAMTGSWSVWSDTLWINGYSGSDVKSMNALHFLRNGEPRFAISTQNHDATSYGTYYEAITAYNIASQSVSYASSAGNADTVDGYHMNQALLTTSSPSFADGTFGSTDGATNQGIQIRYQNYGSGYGRIRFYQSNSNHSTIHSFSSSWQSGSLAGHSTGAINIAGSNGVTFGDWDNVDMWIDRAGNAQARGSLRAPIFYDSEDTGYYVDPDSVSKLSLLGLGGASADVALSVSGDSHISGYIYQGGAGGSVSSWGSRTLVSSGNYVSNANSFRFDNVGFGSTWSFVIDSGGAATASASLRAPIFYDSNDTNYYLDPAGYSRLSRVHPRNLGGATLNEHSTNVGVSQSGNWEKTTFIDGSEVLAHVSTGNGNNGNCYNWFNTEYVSVDPNKDYEFSVWVKSTGDDNIYMGWHEANSDGTTLTSNPYFHTDKSNTNGTWIKLTARLKGWQTTSGYGPGDPDRWASSQSMLSQLPSGGTSSDGVMHETTTSVHMRCGTCYGTVNGSKTYFYAPRIREITYDEVQNHIVIPYYNGSNWGGKLRFGYNDWGYYGIGMYGAAGEFRMSSDSGDLNLRVDGWVIGTNYVQSTSAMYSPIYYDGNDNDYYLDLNSGSNSAMRIRGGTLHGPNPTWGKY